MKQKGKKPRKSVERAGKYKARVFVGMSGGVDSSVSAALLKKAGFDVTGVFIKTWSPDWLPCTWREERLDAMRVSAKLEIPFITLDLEKEYKKEVIDNMIEEYKKGRTPNPDVMCNKKIKFGAFYDWAREKGADFVATGHYARVREETITKHQSPIAQVSEETITNHQSPIARVREEKITKHQSPKGRGGVYSLLAGVDKDKDQSYFLWQIRSEQLPHILFPVGDKTKTEVRKLARKFDLPTAEKKDSQGLCFVGKIDLKKFLSRYIQTKPGNVLNEKGEVIGSHQGAEFFTIGERHGFEITKKTPNDAPRFVVSKDVAKNEIVVASLNVTSTGKETQTVKLEKINLINALPGAQLKARIRYRQPLQKITIKEVAGVNDEMEIQFASPQIIAPGQSAVFYHGDKCLGGGIIAERRQ
jgi:tRNA-uridine 2-sulfurtransferase